MQHQGRAGICPSCEVDGPVGDACTDARCNRRGYHYIPIDQWDRDARPPDPLVGQAWDNHLLVRKLGAGGVGAVYLALQRPIGLRTALKVLHARQRRESTMAQRFHAEAAALARLVHPNIVRLVGAGSHDEHPYIAMEYIEGARTLADEMKAGIDLEGVRRILLQVVDALESAHAVNVVHRDIKPANIMLQSTGREPYFVRLVDFGLVKFTDDGASTQLAAGTPIYMAPEQVRRAEIGPWTDWYAVGVMGLELITGRRPFPKMASHVLLQRKLLGSADPLEPMADLVLPPAVRRFVERTTVTEPQARVQTAAEMVELIERAFAELRARSAHPQPLAPPGPVSAAVASDTASDVGSASMSIAAGEVNAPLEAPRRRRVVTGVVAAIAVVAALASWRVLGPTADDAAAVASAVVDAGSHATVGGSARHARSLDAGSVDATPDATPDAMADAMPETAPDVTPDAVPEPRRPAKRRTRRSTSRRAARPPRPAAKAEPSAPVGAERINSGAMEIEEL